MSDENKHEVKNDMAKIGIAAFHPGIITMLKPRLERLGHEIVEIDRDSVISQLTEKCFDLIIIDKALIALLPGGLTPFLGQKAVFCFVDDYTLRLSGHQLRPGEENLDGLLQRLSRLLSAAGKDKEQEALWFSFEDCPNY